MSSITALAKRFALAHKIDVSLLSGSGFRQKILLKDIKDFLAKSLNTVDYKFSTKKDSQLKIKRMPPAILNLSADLDKKRQKISPIRKAIARAMITSQENVAYFNLVHEANVSELWETRNQIKEIVFQNSNIKITFLAYVVKAVTIALENYQIVHAQFDSQSEELVYPDSAHIGIAVDTEKGLLVPVIKDAQNLSIVQIASEIKRLAKLAREGKLKAGEMQGATFTITNYGSIGSYFGTPIINFPEVAILGLGTITNKIMVVNQELKAAKSLYLTSAADHRFIDGSTIGRFTSKIKELLENPQLLGVF